MNEKKIHPADRHLSELITIIKTLRGDNGCPWDKKQTSQTLTKYIREETEELLEGIANNDSQNICEELGDVLYLILMVSEIHSEKNDFTVTDVINTVSEKLVRRHPHVFTDLEMKDEAELTALWNKIKKEEKKKI